MPRKSSAIPKKQASKKAQAFSETPRLISEQEKHQLIMAHAAARAPQDPLQRVSLWAGVTLSVVMLVVGWWMTVGTSVRETIVNDDSQLRELTQKLNQFTERVQADPSLGLDGLVNPTAQASAAAFNDLLRQNLDESITTTTRDDLISAGPESASSTRGTTRPSNGSRSGLTPEMPTE